MENVASVFHMWVTYGVIVVALALYAWERVPIEVTSVGVVCTLLVFFHLFPLAGPEGANLLPADRILGGFSNPALIAVLALLVMGQGMVRTGVLERGARVVLAATGRPGLAVPLVLIAALVISGFLNNIPVVVIFIPVMQVLAERMGGGSTGSIMMPLSFAAVLGGMVTLIGSSTNLLVNSALIELGATPFGFFDFTGIGLAMAGTGLLYVLFVVPRLLPARTGMADDFAGRDGRQFIAQITVSPGSPLIGAASRLGHFAELPDMTVRMIQREELAIFPPFEATTLQQGDVLVVAATRQALREVAARETGGAIPSLGDGDPGEAAGRPARGARETMLAEVLVPPASRLIGQTLTQNGFRFRTRCLVLGVQRRSRMIRTRMTDIRLEPGDEMLVQGRPEHVRALGDNPDVILLESSTEELPVMNRARRAVLIFLVAVGLAATGILPVVVATLCGAAAMVAFGVLQPWQAGRALDLRIAATIVAALALGVCLQETGGADYLAGILAGAMAGMAPTALLSAFFLLVAILSNIISTKTCAVLFTPIAIDLARAIGAPPEAFAVAVVFAANCSFASPLGYQTNLLVMGPGHYRFIDFVRAGSPLIILMWLAFSLFAPWFYDL